MSIKDEIIKKMEDKNLSENSINYYIRNLELLNDNKPIKNFNFLKDIDDISKRLDTKKPNTQRSYYISIVAILSLFDDKKIKKIMLPYYEKMMELNRNFKADESKNEKTDKQKQNWIEKEEIVNKLNDLVDKCKTFKNPVSESEFNTCLKMVILSVFSLIPPRRNKDFQNMLIVKNKIPKELEDIKINFIIVNKKQFIFRDYKTAHAELKDSNELVIDINDDLMNNINLYLKYHPTYHKKADADENLCWFLCDYDGTKLNSINAITYILNRIFNKKIGVSMLRHFYTSHKYGNVLNEMKNDAAAMSHSVNQQRDYIKV